MPSYIVYETYYKRGETDVSSFYNQNDFMIYIREFLKVNMYDSYYEKYEIEEDGIADLSLKSAVVLALNVSKDILEDQRGWGIVDIVEVNGEFTMFQV